MSTIEKITIPESIIVEFEAIVPREGTVPVENKSVTITENGSHEVTANPNTVMSKVDITVDVEGSLPISNKEVSYTENGTFEVTAYEGTTMNNVKVEVDVPQPILSPLSKSFTDNGKYTFAPNVNEGYSLVDIDINVPSPQLTELSKTITKNGDYQYTGAFDEVNLHVEVEADIPQTVLVEREETIEENGEYEYIPNSGSAYSKVKVKVEVPDIYKEMELHGFSSKYAAAYETIVKNTRAGFEKNTYTKSEFDAVKNAILMFGDLSLSFIPSFNYCNELLQIGNITIPNGSVSMMFPNTARLKYVGNINCQMQNVQTMFNSGTGIEELGTMDWSLINSNTSNINVVSKLKELGGIIGLHISLNVSNLSQLSPQSVRNIMYYAETVTSATTLTLHATAKANFLAECETNEEYAQVYDDFINVKGWTLA